MDLDRVNISSFDDASRKERIGQLQYIHELAGTGQEQINSLTDNQHMTMNETDALMQALQTVRRICETMADHV